MHKYRGDEVEYCNELEPASKRPKLIYITSLFTYSWSPVHKAADFYRSLYPKATIVLGGIYATLMTEHAKLANVDEVRPGLVTEAERYRPDYSLVPEWKSSILFATRGCIRKCAFCAVPRLEGKPGGPAESILDLISNDHKSLVLWDNNIIGVSNWRDVVAEIRELGMTVDFNQGLDARLINSGVAKDLAGLRIKPLRMAYDIPNEKSALETAIPALNDVGFRRDRMIVYTLYNFTDTPDDFWRRVRDLLSWGVVSYPMRYEPLDSLIKNKYVSPHWTTEKLELVAIARRVIGFGGAFPPYRALIDKIRNATSFQEAFSIRAGRSDRNRPHAASGIVEEPTRSLTNRRSEFRELLNDPTTLLAQVKCQNCDSTVGVGERAFAVQDYRGRYVGYLCPNCHPNNKWINGLWRSTLGEGFSRNGREPTALSADLISRTVH